MTMHLVHPSLSTTGKKKGKQKPEFWDKLTELFGKEVKITLKW